MCVPKKEFITRNEHDDLEKNGDSDFSSSVGMKVDKSYVEKDFKKLFIRIKNFVWGVHHP